MTISVVIPSYGQAPYLRDAVDSALSQTYEGIEVIVVDDGSHDGSLAIAQEYGHEIKLVAQKNKGLASARNAGIMNATGEYVFFLDADDGMFPNCIEKIVETIQATDADVVCPSIRCVVDGLTLAQDTILMPSPTFGDFKEGNRLAYCCAYKREALLEVGGYSPKMDVLGGWEDLWMHYAMMECGKKIVTIQEPLVLYRVKEKSMWKDAQKNSEALWAQIVKDFPQAKDHAKS
jgi:glycosyltransferase involved in cell wall biosynthesis